ncbi:hypothetical protein A9K79_14245 [Pseudomonas syringae pv. syringae]|uniref:restriction endonuclease subunit S n=1 Tax=Pseudomonas syringae TaxID=317 RepID=UPI0007EE36AA|nr:restriction endonuclease subunit S [Pseudomonas syringae]OBS38866.1 hypothetical protein A9K79_14245 [Pseudomonas syringae pv. syringae]
MNEWQDYFVEDIAAPGKNSLSTGPFGSSISSKFFVAHGVPVIRGGNLSPQVGKRFNDEGLVFVSSEKAEEFSRSVVSSGDLIFTCWGTINQVGLIDDKTQYPKYVISNKQMKLSVDPSKASPLFLYYLFSTPDKQQEILNNGIGAAVPGFNLGQLRRMTVSLPTLKRQESIAAILNCFDEKLDLLHRQNKTLEDIAEALFRQWFIEEAHESWEPVELGQLVDCFNGVSYKSEDLNPSSTAMVTLKNFNRDGGFRLDGFKGFTGKHKDTHIVIQGDLVVAHTDITQEADVIGNPVLIVADPAYEKLVISMDLVKVVSKYEWLSNEFLYRMMRTREFKQHCLGYSNGSTVLHLNKQAIPSYEVLLPPEQKVIDYTKIAKNILNKKFENIAQFRTLESLRDTLLPKLISGEVRVSY